jgi:16S rRNA (uracil1498-N3)-methyltransferase
MPRFFVDKINIHLDNIVITGDDVKHIGKVLRLVYGDLITVCDGEGTDYTVRIERYNKDSIFTSIINSNKNKTEPPIEVTLFQGIPKSDKMDFIIQKSVELGIRKIVPVITERTIIRFDNNKGFDKRATRWQRISLEAAKQCNRGIMPQVEFPLNFEEALEFCADSDLSLIPYEKEKLNCLKSIISFNPKKAAVFIGPEGGFSEAEIAEAVNFNIKPVSLGPRILRTETAGIALLSILMYEWGDMG